MGRFSNAELRKFRDTSRCSACVHYSGCQIWLALLLMNNELAAPGLDYRPRHNQSLPDVLPLVFSVSAQRYQKLRIASDLSSGGPQMRGQ